MRTIVFTGGGTAGHIMPNIALISALRHEYNCVYVAGNGMEKQLCKERGIEFFETRTVKLRRGKLLCNLAVPFRLCACVREAKALLRQIKPDLIFGKGGYAALPVSLAAGDIPLLVHESDLSPGLTTRLCARRARLVLTAFEDCAGRFKNGRYVGAPLDRALYGGMRDPARYGLSGSRPILGIVGGSSGAATLNALAAAAADRLLAHFDIIHITGKNKSGGAPKAGYTAIEFETDMPTFYATVDAVVTRAGANALCECVALGVPALAVPLEHASRGDQVQNASYFAARGAVAVARERELTPLSLTDAVHRLYDGREEYKRAMKALNVDGTAAICGIIRKTLQDQA